MLFLVASPRRSRRARPKSRRTASRSGWIDGYRQKSVCKQIFPRVGRGAVAIFDVGSNNDLHRILNEWADIIPAQFDTYPLVDMQATADLLASQVTGKSSN